MKTFSRLNPPLWLITASLATILPPAILLLSAQTSHAQETISTSAAVPFYEAESSGNTRTGTAVVQGCPSCSGGMKVGYVGNNAGTLQCKRGWELCIANSLHKRRSDADSLSEH